MNESILVSIVVPTFNRLARLCRCISKVRANVALPFELVIVDGGSTDGTRALLAGDGNLHVILEQERAGAVKAFNKGFRAAKGRYVMWLNDDAYPLPGSVEAAVATLKRHPDVGMTAFYHDWDRTRNILDSVERDGRRYSIYNVRGYPYANFGILRKSLLREIGFADERFYFFGFDPDLSLKVQLAAGLKVVGCRDAVIHHEEFHDERKISDLAVGEEDNRKLFAKWNLPDAGSYPNPAETYRAMVRSLDETPRCKSAV